MDDTEFWKENKLNLYILQKRWEKGNRCGKGFCITLCNPNHVPHSGYQQSWRLNEYTFRKCKYELISKVIDMENQYDLLLQELEELEKHENETL